ncbi:hypothetical protein [Stenotrophomonas lactitubi]|jgi:hypothetical protein|uniref:hypothetical protein n=1 Tax=Stenotrophomonas lactitubi TaxID=2045214 RepID=UPI0033418169
MSSLSEALNGTKSPLEKLEHALSMASVNGKSKLEGDFRQAYSLFEQNIARKVRKKFLMEEFNRAYQHQLNLVQFRKMLNSERNRRKADGDELACASCGQVLCPASGEIATNAITEEA